MKFLKKLLPLFLVALLTILSCNQLHSHNVRDTLRHGARIMFSENLGQWQSHVLFRSQMHGATLFAERDCFTFVIEHPDNPNLHHPLHADDLKRSFKTHAYRLHFDGCRTSAVEGTERMTGYENYYIGRDPSRWASGVGVFQSIVYHDLYENIDMKVYAARGAMKYDFIVAPGGDPALIAMSYEGVDKVKLHNGSVRLSTSVAEIVEMRPYAYQFVDGKQVEVACSYKLKGNQVTFAVGTYDRELPLIIDPYLYFSTYTGSTADNWGTTGCFDSDKNTYTSGVVFGYGYPVSLGSYDGSYNGNCDIGIFKFDTTGSQRLYATYLGGSLADMPHSLIVNSFDELVIFGTTGSADFPVTDNALDTSFNGGDSVAFEGSTTINFRYGSDIFICRFNKDGTQLQASTYVGGSGNDGLNYRNTFDYSTIMLGNDSLYYNYGDGARGEIITDDLNNIYVGSSTLSTDFPVTAGCLQPNSGGRQDGVVFKIDYNLAHLMWSTYLGGGKDDAIYSVDCDSDYNVLVCGGTNSLNFPTTAAGYDHSYNGGSADGFVTKISYYGTSMMASTYIGSAAYDQCYFVRCSKNNDVFLFGQTKASGSAMIRNANYNSPGSGQLLVRFKPLLDSIRWSTVFGTGDAATNGPNLSPTAFSVDICNRIYLSGWGRVFLGRSLGSGIFYQWNSRGTEGMTITSDAYQSTTDGQDFYIMSLDMDANDLVYASFFGELHNSSSYYSGADHVDGGTSRFDRMGTLYQSVCASCGGNDDFPVTTGAFGQHNNSSNCNNAIFRINLTDDFPVADFNYTRSSNCNPTTITFNNSGRGTSYLWDFGDGTTSTDANPSHNYPFAGFYTVTLIAYMPNGCREADTISKEITILSGTNVPPLDTLSTCPGTPIQIGVHPEAGLTYHWINGAVSDSNIANPMAEQPGVYRLWIMEGDDYGCGKLLEQVIVAGEANARIVGDTVTCSSPTVVSADADGLGVIYQWSSSSSFSDTLNDDMTVPDYTFTPSGTQWLYLYVTDELGCFKSDSIHIRFYNVVDHIETVDPLCPDDCSGTATVVSNGYATPPLDYSWSSGWNTGDSSRTALCAGDYDVWMRDAAGCTVKSVFTINSPEVPDISGTIEHIHCQESCTGSISVSISGNSTYSLLWLDDSTTVANRDSLCAGVYTIQVTDSNGCLFEETFEILDNVDIQLDIELLKSTCPNSCNGSAVATISGGTAPYTFAWSNGEQTATATQLCEGTTYLTGTDSYGCAVSDSVVVGHIDTFDGIEVWADDSVVFNGRATTVHATAKEGISYWWTPSTMVVNPSSATTPTTEMHDSTTFTVTMTDTAGCTHTDSVAVGCFSVNCGSPNIHIPNAFTPNGDGRNDELCISGEWVDEFHIAIFTRWGEKVYESDNMNDCWDGRFRDNNCMPGVYVYHCRIRCRDGQVGQFKGDITLIR